MWLFYHRVALDYDIYPLLLFCFMLLFITICCTDFYLIVLCSSLLISFLFNSVPALYSTNGSWCIPALHMVFLPCNRGGPRISSYCFVLDYPFINQIFHFSFFPSSHFGHVSALLCLAITLVGIFSITERLPVAALTTTLPSIQPPATTLLVDTMLLRLFTAHTFPYINYVLKQQAKACCFNM
jgi:hypothetical protein